LKSEVKESNGSLESEPLASGNFCDL